MDMRRQWMLDLALVVTVMVLGIFIAAQFQRHPVRAQAPASKLKLPPLPTGLPNYPAIPAQQPVGAPAIHPAKGSLSSDEVRQFLTSNPSPVGVKGVPNVTITRSDCGLPASKVSNMLPGKSLGLPAGMPLCYVELSGTFTVYTPPTPKAPHGTPVTFRNGFKVFDANTGNVMVTGALNQPAAP